MDDLKRVGLSFKADGTADFKKSLKEVNAAVKENYSEFKLAQSTWDKSTSTTEKLEARQKYLANQTSLYTDKVAVLTEELKQMKEEENADATAIEKKQTQLNQTQAKLNEYDKSLKKVNDDLKYHTSQLKEAGKNMQDAGGKITDAGKKMSVVSAAVGGLGVAAVKTAADFETSMSKVAALSGASGDELEALEKKAREMGASTKFSATESADAMGYMALAGWDTNKMLAAIEPILNLAAASEMDLATASDIVTDYMTAFGIECDDAGKNATHFSDMMAYAMANSNTTTEMLTEAYKNVAATAASMGYTAEETTAVLMTMANAGVKGGEAGTALSAIMTRLATDTKGCASSLAEYGVQVYDSEGNMNSLSSILEGCKNVWNGLTQEQQANLAKSIAGTNHYSKFQTIMSGLQEGAEGAGSSFTNYAQALTKCDGAAGDMAATMQDNLNGQITEVKSKLEESAISIGQSFMPVIKEIVDKIGEWVDQFNSLDDGTKNTIVVIGLIIAAIGPLLILVGSMASGIGSIISLAAILIPIIGGISAPVLAVIAVIALLVAGGVNLYKNWDTIRANCSQVWNDVKNTTSGAVNSVIGFFNNIIGFIKGTWNSVTSFISAPFVNAFNELRGACNVFSWFMGSFINGVRGLFNFSFSWPHIPLPHFGISPSGWKVGDLLKGKIPSLSIDWYAQGGILNHPTVFGMNGTHPMVGGEAGAEAIAPISKLLDYMRIVNDEQSNMLAQIMMQAVYDGVRKALKELGITVELDDEKVGEIFAKYLRKELFT